MINTSKFCHVVFKALIRTIGVLDCIIYSMYPSNALLKSYVPWVKFDIKVIPNVLASGFSMNVSTSKIGTEKSIARTTIISLLVVKSDSIFPTLDSCG